jgi:hypothetical protein
MGGVLEIENLVKDGVRESGDFDVDKFATHADGKGAQVEVFCMCRVGELATLGACSDGEDNRERNGGTEK